MDIENKASGHRDDPEISPCMPHHYPQEGALDPVPPRREGTDKPEHNIRHKKTKWYTTKEEN